MALSIKYVLDGNVQSSAFRNPLRLGLCCNSVALNISFQDSENPRKMSIEEIWIELEIKMCFLGQSWKIEFMNEFTKVSKTDFSMECFTNDFSRIFSTNIQNCLMDGRLGTCHQI